MQFVTLAPLRVYGKDIRKRFKRLTNNEIKAREIFNKFHLNFVTDGKSILVSNLILMEKV